MTHSPQAAERKKRKAEIDPLPAQALPYWNMLDSTLALQDRGKRGNRLILLQKLHLSHP